jgi:hypothetical protein
MFLLFILIGGCTQNAVKEDNTADNKSPVTQKEAVKETVKPVDNSVKESSEYFSNDDILKVYKSLIIRVSSKKNNKSNDIEIEIGGKKDLEDPSFSIGIVSYFPDFVMDEKRGVITKSLEDRNPAAKVKIYKNDKLVFNGWLFANFPDIHAFEDPEYNIKLISSVKRN